MKIVKSMMLGLAIGTVMGIVMFPEFDRKELDVWLMIHMTILCVI